MKLNEWLPLFSALLVVLTIVYKAGKIEQLLSNLVTKVDTNTTDIKDLQDEQGKQTANLAALNQATGVYSR